jgi:hypothetical protein
VGDGSQTQDRAYGEGGEGDGLTILCWSRPGGRAGGGPKIRRNAVSGTVSLRMATTWRTRGSFPVPGRTAMDSLVPLVQIAGHDMGTRHEMNSAAPDKSGAEEPGGRGVF